MLQEFLTNSSVEDDATSEASVADLSRFIPRMPSSTSIAHVISIGQLMESVTTFFHTLLVLHFCVHKHLCVQNDFTTNLT